MMHPQAQRLKEKLVKAGFPRAQVTVRTIRYTTKADRAMYGDYGNAWALFHYPCTLEDRIQRIDTMLEAGLDVVVGRSNGEIVSVDPRDHGKERGQLQEMDLTEVAVGNV